MTKYNHPESGAVRNTRRARGLSTPQPLPLPVVDPEQFPMVAACLALGGVIVAISEDPDAPAESIFLPE